MGVKLLTCPYFSVPVMHQGMHLFQTTLPVPKQPSQHLPLCIWQSPEKWAQIVKPPFFLLLSKSIWLRTSSPLVAGCSQKQMFVPYLLLAYVSSNWHCGKRPCFERERDPPGAPSKPKQQQLTWLFIRSGEREFVENQTWFVKKPK